MTGGYKMKFEKPFNVIYDPEENGWAMKVPMKLWLSEIEDGALNQLYNLTRLPFAFHHVCAMSDCHRGYGMPIGGVLATKGYVIPNAVGKDIGCGMSTIRTNLFTGSLDKTILKKIMADIRKLIPIGVGGKHKNAQNIMPTSMHSNSPRPILEREFDNATKQLGTLGSGNHFIELQKGDNGYIYIMLHSGSRNLGSKVCDYYNKIAKDLNEKWYASVPSNWGLSFLPIDSKEGKMYLNEMQYCCDYALANRKLMMERIKEALLNHLDVKFDDYSFINIHHNYAAMENHFGQNVLIHRKGATRAYEGELGIIPGNQGSKSYIVRGKGNPDSFKSCSHGAGRVMSRTEAKKELNLQDEIEKLDKQGIVHAIRTKKDLEEAPSAYKNIDKVMEHQKDLVSIEVELTPIAVLKG
jgi:tRNA-splicing ligase RtcB (3'-phosphate/5'-hydroxy nucleic acid ligase)